MDGCVTPSTYVYGWVCLPDVGRGIATEVSVYVSVNGADEDNAWRSEVCGKEL